MKLSNILVGRNFDELNEILHSCGHDRITETEDVKRLYEALKKFVQDPSLFEQLDYTEEEKEQLYMTVGQMVVDSQDFNFMLEKLIGKNNDGRQSAPGSSELEGEEADFTNETFYPGDTIRVKRKWSTPGEWDKTFVVIEDRGRSVLVSPNWETGMSIVPTEQFLKEYIASREVPVKSDRELAEIANNNFLKKLNTTMTKNKHKFRLSYWVNLDNYTLTVQLAVDTPFNAGEMMLMAAQLMVPELPFGIQYVDRDYPLLPDGQGVSRDNMNAFYGGNPSKGYMPKGGTAFIMYELRINGKVKPINSDNLEAPKIDYDARIQAIEERTGNYEDVDISNEVKDPNKFTKTENISLPWEEDELWDIVTFDPSGGDQNDWRVQFMDYFNSDIYENSETVSSITEARRDEFTITEIIDQTARGHKFDADKRFYLFLKGGKKNSYIELEGDFNIERGINYPVDIVMHPSSHGYPASYGETVYEYNMATESHRFLKSFWNR